MIRKIIQIDEEKCNGCGACAAACHEGAIGMVNGKARLLRDDYCDGLGDCLPACPTGAISFVEREAAAYDEAAVLEKKRAGQERRAGGKNPEPAAAPVFAGCPGSRMRRLGNQASAGLAPVGSASAGLAPVGAAPVGAASAALVSVGSAPVGSASAALASVGSAPAGLASAGSALAEAADVGIAPAVSQLGQWPCQIKLVPVNAPYFDGAKLLIAADCTAYAYARMHETFMRGKITLIGCPKLDGVDYSEKLTQIIRDNDIRSVTVVRMEVPCCGGLEAAVRKALQESGKWIPWQVATISIDGRILE